MIPGQLSIYDYLPRPCTCGRAALHPTRHHPTCDVWEPDSSDPSGDLNPSDAYSPPERADAFSDPSNPSYPPPHEQ